MPPFVVPLFPYYAAYAVMSFFCKEHYVATEQDRNAMMLRFADADELDWKLFLEREIDFVSVRAGRNTIVRLRDQIDGTRDERQTGDRYNEISQFFLGNAEEEIRTAFERFDTEHQERFRKHVLAMDYHAYAMLERYAGNN